uniref:CaMBD domain-containing protein n=1 Tax=Globodera pallida TaxID=36090 RepID=A0A183BHZ0_GLOPA
MPSIASPRATSSTASPSVPRSCRVPDTASPPPLSLPRGDLSGFAGGGRAVSGTVNGPPSTASSPTATGIRHTLGSNSTFQQTLDRRKTFRCRGSLGPTVASAPSVEHEDYRTPKPSVLAIGKSGKSFDDLGGEAAGCSKNNGLVKVSADFLRLNGSRQQFRSLLSRKKLGQMPPAYTQIDDYCSYESVDSNNTGGGRTGAAHPLIKVEDAGGEIAARRKVPPPPIPKKRSNASAVVLIDSQHSSVEKWPQLENGGPPQHILVGGLYPPPGGGHATMAQSPHSINFKRNNSRYGTPIDGSAVKMVYKIRSQRLSDRVRITDRCLILAMLGILLMDHFASLLIRSLVLLSTLALLVQIVHFHVNEIQLDLVDCGADDWRVVLSWRRLWQFFAEFLFCSIIPLPGTGTLRWSFVEPSRSWTTHQQATLDEHSLYQMRDVPVDVVLSLLMLSRVYLVGRWQVLHSKQFQDASTRTLAALNRIQVNFAFVLKTVLDQRPMLFLSIFLLIFWLITAWSFAQCERFGRDEDDPFILYTNALWFIAITFNGNGYGDIVPKSLAGRLIAILVGISGAVISSILIAVISRKILLSQGQKNVNNFMNDSRLTLAHKHAAARVLQKTWHIYRCLRSSDTPDHQLRRHQRKFLNAIHQFRRIKNKMRSFGENSSASMQQLSRLMTEMNTHTQRLALAQEEMRAQIEVLQRAMRNHFTQQQQDGSNSPNGISSGRRHNFVTTLPSMDRESAPYQTQQQQQQITVGGFHPKRLF